MYRELDNIIIVYIVALSIVVTFNESNVSNAVDVSDVLQYVRIDR